MLKGFLSFRALVMACATASLPGILGAQTGTLPVPPLLTPAVQGDTKVFTLNMQKSQSQLVPGLTSDTMGFNGAFLGPTIRVSEGDVVHMSVTNNLGEDTTVHWHGMHVPAIFDGGIEQVIHPGQTWNPQFTIRQPASTNWYHPHIMGVTAKQLAYGLAGMLIVDDNSAASAALPHQYGVDDIPLILQSQILGSNGAIKYDETTMGAPDETFPLLVNGVNTDTLHTFNTTQNRVRLRLLNASIGDILTVSFADGQPFAEVATDGGYLPGPLQVTSVRICPGERAEIVVDLPQSRTLLADVESTLISGGSGRHTIVQLNPLNALTAPLPALPPVLNTIVPLNTAGSTSRTFLFTQDGAGFGINGIDGRSMDDLMRSETHVKVGTTEVWTVVNQTEQNHDFHMHETPFQILSVNGALPSGDKIGWKDTVEVPPGTSVQLAMHFSDYTDSQNPYMLHCHLAPHEDQGMMALFYVDPVVNSNRLQSISDYDGDNKNDYTVWRPASGMWYTVPSTNPGAPTVRQWGLPGDIPVRADFDGDKKHDAAVWRPFSGTWYIVPSTNPGSLIVQQWGLPGDIPVAADYDGDGKSDYAVWRPSNATWYVIPSSNPSAPITRQWGFPGDIPVPADYDNDGKVDFAVWRPSDGTWYIIASSSLSNPYVHPYMQRWGLPGDLPVPGDFDGDGKIDFAVWRQSTGTWYVMPSSNPAGWYSMQWGLPGDVPRPNDFDGDGRADLAVWRPANGTWYVIPSSNPGAPYAQQWGLPGDVPF